MNYKVISTGSKGNCTIINNQIAIDIGVSYKKISKYANELKLVLLTHVHSDHFNKKTIEILYKNHPLIKFVCLKHIVKELSEIVDKNSIYVVEKDKLYDLGICKLSAFELKHDVENNGWKLLVNGEKCIYATDTSVLNASATNYNLYLIEANYDLADTLKRLQEKELKGEYAYERRAIQNHLSKQQCEEWLSVNAGINSEIVYMHQHEDEK